MQLAWITDPHLNFLTHPKSLLRTGALEFGEEQAGRSFDNILITGDITEYPYLYTDLGAFAKGIASHHPNAAIYFVLGNHDYYGGSFHKAEVSASSVQTDKLIYLSERATGIQLADDTWLVGQDGLYDVRAGVREQSLVQMSDHYLIEDFAVNLRESRRTMAEIKEIARRQADLQAAAAEQKLRQLPDKTHVIFATHYPPYVGACWHKDEISDEHWLPWFTSIAMGEAITRVAKERPDTTYTVLCGHTHSGGYYSHADNVHVRTGAATYGVPRIYATIDIL